MRVDLQKPDSWEASNQVYREALGLGEGGYNTQIYMGVKHALWEICAALTQLMPSKRSVVYLKDAAPVFETVAVHLSREGFKVRPMTEAELRQPETWLDASLKDLLLLMHLNDDPVTGELYDFPELDGALKDKRVYRLSVSHSRHTCLAPQAPQPFEAQVLSLTGERALAILGERVKVSPPVAAGMNWPAVSVERAAAELSLLSGEAYATMRSRVQAFETSLPSGASPVLDASRARLYDRTLFSFTDLDGLAFITELAQDLGLALRAPGERGFLETSSLCRWNDERSIAALVSRGFPAEVIRGLVLLSAEALAGDVKKKIEAARDRVLRLQSGD